jgi:hypothetical protein
MFVGWGFRRRPWLSFSVKETRRLTAEMDLATQRYPWLPRDILGHKKISLANSLEDLKQVGAKEN